MLPIKLRSERCANDLNHFQLKVPSGTFSIAEIDLGGGGHQTGPHLFAPRCRVVSSINEK